MRRLWSHTIVRVVVALVVIAVLVVGGYAVNLASDANMLPWQPEPTRISEAIRPFEGIPGFGDETATPTP
jgi:hypothetical protein